MSLREYIAKQPAHVKVGLGLVVFGFALQVGLSVGILIQLT